jgi:mercuric reductase
MSRAVLADGGAFVLRPGVLMPDWSLVADPVAREALGTSMAVAGRAEKWSGLSAVEDLVWQAVLRGFARSGRAPETAQLAAAAGLDEAAATSVLRALHQRDLVVLDEGRTSITTAYPFSGGETGHVVRLASGVAVNALCAIDALGIGAMLGCDTVIDSPCRSCGVPVRITTRDDGHALGSVTPSTAIVWSGIRYADACAATSGCTVKVFFCSDDHLAAWRGRSDPDGPGFRLSVDAALQVGKALFVPMLATHAEAISEER